MNLKYFFLAIWAFQNKQTILAGVISCSYNTAQNIDHFKYNEVYSQELYLAVKIPRIKESTQILKQVH